MDRARAVDERALGPDGALQIGDDVAGRGAGPEDPAHTLLRQVGQVLIGDDAAAGDDDVVGALLDGVLDDLLGCLRDAGMEVIYTGIKQTPEQIVQAAIQEDVDVVGLSCLSGAHNTLFPKVIKLLRQQGADDVIITGGGIIPDEDLPYLTEQGVSRIFGPGTSTRDIVAYL